MQNWSAHVKVRENNHSKQQTITQKYPIEYQNVSVEKEQRAT